MDVIGQIVSAIKSAVSDLATFVTNLVSQTAQDVEAMLPVIRARLASIFNGAKSLLEGLILGFKDYIEMAVKNIKVEKIGSNVVSGIRDAFRDVEKDILEMIKCAVDKTESLLKLADLSFKSMLEGLNTILHDSLKASESIIKTLKTTIVALVRQLEALTGTIISKTLSLTRSGISDIEGVMKDSANILSSTVSGISSSVSTISIDTLKNGTKELESAVITGALESSSMENFFISTVGVGFAGVLLYMVAMYS